MDELDRQFARRTTGSVLTDIYTGMHRTISPAWASRVYNEGVGRGNGRLRRPYTTYGEVPRVPLADDLNSDFHSSKYLLESLKISKEHFAEIAAAAGRYGALRFSPILGVYLTISPHLGCILNYLRRMDPMRRVAGSAPPRAGKAKFNIAEQVNVF